MLLSISLILMTGMFLGWICLKCKLPSLLGMLAAGIVLGPYMLNLLDSSILGISAEIRKIALIIILTRAGLGLDLSGLKKIGRPAALMCFVPATFELIGVILTAPGLMGLTTLEASVMGVVLAAVSPAVVVGTADGIPLALGLACGDTLLTAAVLAIVLTAPLGAFAIDLSYKKLLTK